MPEERSIVNWAGNQVFTPRRVEEPSTLHELVAVVRKAADEGRHVRAVGSVWSFPDIVRCEDVAILPTNLRGVLSVAKAPAWEGTLANALKPELRGDATRAFVQVRSGERLVDVLEKLSAEGLALSTMGSSAGQTVAGVTATGSHGADFDLRPVADCIRAVHIVVGDGTQHWIEGAGATGLTSAEGVALLAPGVSPTNVHRDDRMFSAALVHLGSLGIVHSLVFEVRPEYGLQECVQRIQWAEVLAGLDTGKWFRSAPVSPASPVGAQEKYRYLEIHVNPYRTETGHRWSRVITRFESPAIDRPDFRRMKRDVDLLQLIKLLGTLTQGLDEEYRRTIDDLQALGREDTKGYAPSRFVLNTGSESKLPVLSLEIAVSTIDGAHVQLLAGMMKEFDRLRGLGKFFAGFWSVRFTRPTRSLLGMQRFPDTSAGQEVRVCHVEVFSIQQLTAHGMDPTDMWGENEDFVRAFIGVARSLNARLHWGQLGRPFEDQQSSWYPDRDEFLAAKIELAPATGRFSFENDFTVRSGLAALERGWAASGFVTGPTSRAPADARPAARRAPTLAAAGGGAWVVAGNGDGRVAIARHADGVLASFTAIPARSGYVVSDVAVAGIPDGTALVAATFDDGRIRCAQVGDTRVGPWSAVDGVERFSTGPVIVLDLPGNLRIFAVSGGAILESRRDAGGGWSGWRQLPTPASGARPIGRAAAVLDGARVRVAARTSLGEVHSWLEEPGGWVVENLGEPSDVDPVLVAGPVTLVALLAGGSVRVGVRDEAGAFGFRQLGLGVPLAGTGVGAAGGPTGVAVAIVNAHGELALADYAAETKTWSTRPPLSARAISRPALLGLRDQMLVATRVAHDLVQVTTVPRV